MLQDYVIGFLVGVLVTVLWPKLWPVLKVYMRSVNARNSEKK